MSSLLPQRIGRKEHGQYYTKQSIGALLVDRLDHQEVKTAIEFGVGPGALLNEVHRRWPQANCVSVDIDPKHRQVSRGSRAHFCADALEPDISTRIGVEPESADLAVCNPPFITPVWRPDFERILSRTGLLPTHTAAGFGADLLFLAQNLWMLRRHGQLGIIVPSGIICGERSQPLREWLLDRHCISEVIELPAGSFSGTEVKTFVLRLTKDKASSAKIRLSRVSAKGTVSPPIRVTQEEACYRLDYTFHEADLYRGGWGHDPDGTNLQVVRGNITAGSAADLGIRFVHTTDITSSTAQTLRLGRISAALRQQYITAKKGDVLIARVGRDFFKKVAIVESGERIVSDCLFVLRSERYSAQQIQRALMSKKGCQWLSTHSRGACARFITKHDLETFPLKRILGA